VIHLLSAAIGIGRFDDGLDGRFLCYFGVVDIHPNPVSDFEEQRNQVIAAAADTYRIRLDNFRLDTQFLMWTIRTTGINTDWNIDRMQSDPTATILPGGGSVAALQACTSFRLLANGRVLVDTVTELENRAMWRKMYFPGSQIAEQVYFIPFSWLLKDAKNITSFQNMANLVSSS
jgi:hypothetical protein